MIKQIISNNTGIVMPASMSFQSNRFPYSLSLYSADIIVASVAPVAIIALGIIAIPNAMPNTRKVAKIIPPA